MAFEAGIAGVMPQPRGAALILDEMFPSALAAALRPEGHDVVAVCERQELRALSDTELFEWAASARRRIVTENVKDFRPLLARAQGSEGSPAQLLLTSSRTFPRSRRNPAPLLDALRGWLVESAQPDCPAEDWLRPAP